MHQVFITEGIVLGKRGAGESNVLTALLTPEHGLLRVSARSARKEVSKLRYGLEPLTRARYSLVRGRSEWKLTGVERASRDLLSPREARRCQSGKIARLLLRLIRGEEPVPGLYEVTEEGLRSLARVHADADADAVECVLVLRILAYLGYLPNTPELAPFLTADFFSMELAAQVRVSRQSLIRAINESLNASGL